MPCRPRRTHPCPRWRATAKSDDVTGAVLVAQRASSTASWMMPSRRRRSTRAAGRCSVLCHRRVRRPVRRAPGVCSMSRPQRRGKICSARNVGSGCPYPSHDFGEQHVVRVRELSPVPVSSSRDSPDCVENARVVGGSRSRSRRHPAPTSSRQTPRDSCGAGRAFERHRTPPGGTPSMCAETGSVSARGPRRAPTSGWRSP